MYLALVVAIAITSPQTTVTVDPSVLTVRNLPDTIKYPVYAILVGEKIKLAAPSDQIWAYEGNHKAKFSGVNHNETAKEVTLTALEKTADNLTDALKPTAPELLKLTAPAEIGIVSLPTVDPAKLNTPILDAAGKDLTLVAAENGNNVKNDVVPGDSFVITAYQAEVSSILEWSFSPNVSVRVTDGVTDRVMRSPSVEPGVDLKDGVRLDTKEKLSVTFKEGEKNAWLEVKLPGATTLRRWEFTVGAVEGKPILVVQPDVVRAGDTFILKYDAKDTAFKVDLSKEVGNGLWSPESALQVIKATEDSIELKAKRRGRIDFKTKAKAASDVRGGKESEISTQLDVLPAVTGITLSEPISTLVLGQPYKTAFFLFDETGASLANVTGFTVTSSTDTPGVVDASLERRLDGHFILVLRGRKPGPAKITLSTSGLLGEQVTHVIPVEVVTISSLKAVQVALDVMDDTTSRHLFGRQIQQEFHVCRVRIFNSLNKVDIGEFNGKSILAYSESIEAGVALQKRSTLRKNDEWQEVTEADFLENFTLAKANSDNPYPVLVLNSALTNNGVGEGPVSARLKHFSKTTIRPGDRLILGIDRPAIIREYLLRKTGKAPTQAQVDAEMKHFPSWRMETVDPGLLSVAADTGIVTAKVKDGDKKTIKGLAYAEYPKDSRHFFGVEIEVTEPQGTSVKAMATPTAMSKMKQGEHGVVLLENPEVGKWASSNKEAVEVDEATGVLIARRPGISVITFTPTAEANRVLKHAMIEVIADDPLNLPPSTFMQNGELKYLRGRLRYRPYLNDLIFLSQDARFEADPQQKMRRIIESTGNLLNAIIAVADAGSPSGNARFNDTWRDVAGQFDSVVLPIYDSFAPHKPETVRSNLTTLLMAKLEEISFGSDISRILLFPKKPFRGMIPNHEVRIAAVDTSSFTISVALIDKVQSGGDGENPGQ